MPRRSPAHGRLPRRPARPPVLLRRVRWLTVVALALLALGLHGLAQSAGAQDGDGRTVYVVELDGAISKVTARYLSRSLKAAERAGAEVVVVRLDTPGGQLDATRDIVADFLASEVPVVVFVAPDGARAASAGTFLTAAAGIAAMAPVTNIGAASVVGGQGEDLPETMSKKVTEDAAALIRSIAERRGRNAEALEATVREAKAYSANEAVEQGVVDLIAEDLDDLLSQLDGMSIPTGDGARVVHTRDATIRGIDQNLFERALGFLASPDVAFLLLSLGGLALVVELWTPGVGIPGTIGVVFLVLAFASLGSLPFSWAGIGLIALSMALFVAEAHTPGVSFFGIAGVVALLLGGLFLFGFYGTPNPHGPVVRVSWWTLGGVAAVGVGGVAWLAFEVRRAGRIRGYVSPTSHEGLVGSTAVVTRTLDPEGEVAVAGEHWLAETRSGAPVEVGRGVEVVAVHGLALTVTPAPEQGDDAM